MASAVAEIFLEEDREVERGEERPGLGDIGAAAEIEHERLQPGGRRSRASIVW
jgi:hypothetical protein